MKNKIITIMIALLLVGTVIGAVVINNKTVKIDSARQIKAVELGIDVYDTYDEERADGKSRRCLDSRSEFYLGTCSKYMNKNLLDEWEAERIWGDNGILQKQINKDNIIAPEKVREGITTLSK